MHDIDVCLSHELTLERGDEPAVDLDRHHASGHLSQGPGETPSARPDLEHDIIGPDIRLLDELGGNPLATEKVLTARPVCAAT